jgi:hypothetical protein
MKTEDNERPDRERRNTMAKIMYKAGEQATRGNYWNFSNGERISLGSEGMLPGDSGTTYVKAHPVMVLAAGPVLGLVYAAFLPFIGIAMLLKVMATKAFGGALESGAKVATFNWSPSRAFLAGKRAKKATGKDEKRPEEDKTKQE